MFASYDTARWPARPRKEDSEDVRLGAFVRSLGPGEAPDVSKVRETDVVVVGYPDDRGVDRNGGRLGAADAPELVRKFLYAMTPDPLTAPKELRIWDLGDLKSWSLGLAEAHAEARKMIATLRKTGARIITLGGGHDWAYPDLVDFPDRILNLDAHLDMRPVTSDSEASSHSGTPFRKILNQKNDGSRMGVLGLQRHCNARSHLEFAKSLRVTTLFLDEMPSELDAQWRLVKDRFSISSGGGTFALSVDMDAFAQASAPGVSAPQSFGLNPAIALRFLREVGTNVRQIGIYELNPRFDRDHETARLAAKLLYEFLFPYAG